MKNAKKILFTRELHETIIIRSRRRLEIFCTDCQTESTFLTIDETVNSHGIGTREILQKMETGKIHVFDTPDGQMFVCTNSLVKCTKEI